MQKHNYTLSLFLLLALLFGLGGNSVFGQTWNGSVSSDWNDSANWDGGVPNSNSNVNIPNTINLPIISTPVNVHSLTITNWKGATPLTVISGGELTISNSLTFAGGGQIHIDGGEVNLTGSTFTSNWHESSTIEITTGTFTSHANMDFSNGDEHTPALTIGDGSVQINANMSIATDNWIRFNGSGTLEVSGKTVIEGSFYGDNGNTDFYGETTVGSGGRLYLDAGNINFHDYAEIGDNGEAYLGSGTVNVHDDVKIFSSGYLYLQNATLNVTGSTTFTSNGNLVIDSGTLNVGGDATLENGGTLELNSGNLSIGGNAVFTSGGIVNAGSSTITLEGDITIQNDTNFNPDSSTVIFSGDENQTIYVDYGDIVFYDVVVDSGSVFQSDGSNENTIVIENNLTVNDGGSVVIQDDDQIDVQGNLDDESESVIIDRPFIRHIRTPDLNTVIIEFDKDMVKGPLENASNYIIDKGIIVYDAVQDPTNSRLVTLTVSTLTEDVEYELIANNQVGTNGFEMLNNHIKRFGADTIVSFYSRKNGDWGSNSTWSTDGIGGSAASQNPTNTANATIVIDSTHIIMISSDATIADQQSVIVNNDGVLKLTSEGTLNLGNKVISGTGTFEFTTGTLKIGSEDGISSFGSTGSIQTSTRIFGSSGTYVYNGNTEQITGSGLPTEVQNLSIDNTFNVTATQNLEVKGTLFLDNGSLIIPSGQNLIANNKNISGGDLIMELEVHGSTGWRQLSSPISSSYGDLLDNIITQGFSGAYYSTGSLPGDTLQPNVMFYDETYAVNENGGPATDNQRWRAPANASNIIPAGQGIYTFFFGEADDPLYNNPDFDFPVTLNVQGQEHEGDGEKVDLNVTFTADADSGWNLVGNPYAASIDWQNDDEWTKTNIDNTIYIWDTSSNTYKTWNGITGDLENGLISPFQGFWVKANGENPKLQVNKTAKTYGGEYVGKRKTNPNEVPYISFQLSDGQNKTATHFMFSENAKIGKDLYDAYRLAPPPSIFSFVDMASISSNGETFTINNLPRRFGKPIEVPIYVDAFEDGISAGKELTITWDKTNIPHGWTIELVDKERRAKVALDYLEAYTFEQTGSSDILASNIRGKSSKSANKSRKPRFILKISPGEDAGDLPSAYKLEQNYPNPFNPTTKIQFDLPIQSLAELSIYDMLGRKVTTLVQEELSAGTHIYDWNANNLSSGIYIYRLVTNEAVVTKKMTLIK